MGAGEIESYLNHLAAKKRVSASTQASALNAIAFLYRDVFNMEMPQLERFKRLKRRETVPVVMSVKEVQGSLSRMRHPLVDGTTDLRFRYANW